jgi:hypothetical protein
LQLDPRAAPIGGDRADDERRGPCETERDRVGWPKRQEAE